MNDDLEAIDGLCAKIIEQRDRIEVLEAALRQIAALEDLLSSLSVAKSIARAALAPEQDK
jgi:hypothetical protein